MFGFLFVILIVISGVFYLQILVEVFSKELRNFEKYEHLRNFYVIVPSLTVNYVESILNCKGTLGRRSQQNSSFTDDGFVLGKLTKSENSSGP